METVTASTIRRQAALIVGYVALAVLALFTLGLAADATLTHTRRLFGL